MSWYFCPFNVASGQTGALGGGDVPQGALGGDDVPQGALMHGDGQVFHAG